MQQGQWLQRKLYWLARWLPLRKRRGCGGPVEMMNPPSAALPLPQLLRPLPLLREQASLRLTLWAAPQSLPQREIRRTQRPPLLLAGQRAGAGMRRGNFRKQKSMPGRRRRCWQQVETELRLRPETSSLAVQELGQVQVQAKQAAECAHASGSALRQPRVSLKLQVQLRLRLSATLQPMLLHQLNQLMRQAAMDCWPQPRSVHEQQRGRTSQERHRHRLHRRCGCRQAAPTPHRLLQRKHLMLSLQRCLLLLHRDYLTLHQYCPQPQQLRLPDQSGQRIA